ADLLLLDLEAAPGADPVRPFVASPGSEYGPAISPNGEWVAYVSDESGSNEILIEHFPERGQKTRVWSGSSGSPIWSPDGRELYFTAPSTQGSRERDLMAVRVELTPTLRVSAPRRLFSGAFVNGNDTGRAFAITPDGRRFLLLRSHPDYATQLLVVQNWFAELSRTQGESAP
ncbi:MAG: TolB family protein, partial [Vicinamibacteria bacterium]